MNKKQAYIYGMSSPKWGILRILGVNFHKNYVFSWSICHCQCLFYKNRISAENTQIPTPWLFLWVATDPHMIQASKELHIILSRSLSGRLPGSRLAQRPRAASVNNVSSG
jgi:hypothetical protein